MIEYKYPYELSKNQRLRKELIRIQRIENPVKKGQEIAVLERALAKIREAETARQAEKLPFKGTSADGFDYYSEVEDAIVQEIQLSFWESHGVKGDYNLLTGQVEFSKPELGDRKWNDGNCGKYALFFQDNYGYTRRIIRPKNSSREVIVQGQKVANQGQYHVVAISEVDAQKLVWDPGTNTWGQKWDDYIQRFGGGSDNYQTKELSVGQ